MGAPSRRVKATLAAAVVGLLVGGLAAVVTRAFPRAVDYPFLVEYLPYPHHVSKYPDGVSFRFAMVNDVIHERFPRHGADYYRERNRLTREKLAKLSPDDPGRFALDDDLAVGLER